MWISPKTFCSPALASFADSKLLDFAQASDSITYRINRALCCALYTVCMSINPQHMRSCINPSTCQLRLRFLASKFNLIIPLGHETIKILIDIRELSQRAALELDELVFPLFLVLYVYLW